MVGGGKKRQAKRLHPFCISCDTWLWIRLVICLPQRWEEAGGGRSPLICGLHLEGLSWASAQVACGEPALHSMMLALPQEQGSSHCFHHLQTRTGFVGGGGICMLTVDFGIDITEFKHWVHHSLAVWPWGSHLSSLSLPPSGW